MESTETTSIRLEADFDQLLTEIKPYVLKLPQKSGQLTNLHVVYFNIYKISLQLFICLRVLSFLSLLSS